MASFFTQNNSQIICNGLEKTIESLTTLNFAFFTMHLSLFSISNTLTKLFALTFLPRGFLFPQISPGRSLAQFTSSLKHCPLNESFPYHLTLKCSANLFPSSLYASSLLYFVYTLIIRDTFLCVVFFLLSLLNSFH